MARSKSLHIVKHEVNLTQPNDVTGNAADFQIDMAQLLSQNLGRNIRQGNNFRLVGWGATLRGYDSSTDIDMGFAGVCSLEYLQTQRYAVKAWNNVFKQWRAQKNLAGAVGSQIRYDDFEFAWNGTHIVPGRTSTILGQGMNDANSEYLTLIGSSLDNNTFSLQAYADTHFQIPEPSINMFEIPEPFKEPKFSSYYPSIQTIETSATFSASVADLGSTQGDAYFGAHAQNNLTMLPPDNHLDVFCGVMRGYVKLIPPDTASQAADALKLVITLVIEGWSSIASKPKRKSRRKKMTRGRRYGKKRRYYKKT